MARSKVLICGLSLFVILVYVLLHKLAVFGELGVPTMIPTFADLRLITSASECLQYSRWDMTTPSCDPWNRPFNYPALWVHLFAFFRITEAQTDFIGLLEIILLGVTFFYWIWRLYILRRLSVKRFHAIFFLTFVFSPPILLLVERGNVDILIFAGLTLAAELIRRRFFLLSGSIISILASLKLFPLPAVLLPLLSVSSWRKRVSIIAMLFGGLVLVLDDLKYISARSLTPWNSISYGNNLISLIFFQKLGISSPQSLVVVTSLILFGLTTVIIWRLFGSQIDTCAKTIHKVADLTPDFSLFGITFLSSYLVGTSYDYRLVFSFPLFMILVAVLPTAMQKLIVVLFLLLTMYGGHLVAEVYAVGIMFNVFCDAMIMISASFLLLILTHLVKNQNLSLH